ncbi:hypothetical protein [Escherichia coli]|uniref:hypothetical protein n=1 Tax=Escherichia coli TaxID=562 RepID=UPI0018C6DEDB|nr:hypothetical protein [Escherichia coli]MDM1200487.1 hypothetical protein [Escherichia coli]
MKKYYLYESTRESGIIKISSISSATRHDREVKIILKEGVEINLITDTESNAVKCVSAIIKTIKNRSNPANWIVF